MTKVGTEQRVARRIANGPGRLRGEGGNIEELGVRLISTRIEEGVGAISTAAVVRHSAVTVGLGHRLPVGRVDVRRSVVVAGSCIAPIVENREGLTALQDGDGIDLPTGERLLRKTIPGLPVLKLVVQRERKAVLNIILGNAVLDLPKPGRVSI